MLIAKIEYLPKRLQMFRKYIEKYECMTFGCLPTAEDKFSGLLFYHANSDMPYIMLLDYFDQKKHPWVEIYVNTNAKNWQKQENIPVAIEVQLRQNLLTNTDTCNLRP